jgi:hypothetical protein
MLACVMLALVMLDLRKLDLRKQHPVKPQFTNATTRQQQIAPFAHAFDAN